MIEDDSRSDTVPTQGLYVRRQNDHQAIRRAVAMAADYRGDVTLEPVDGASIECFVFDCTGDDVRYMTSTGVRERIAMDHIDAVRFSGKDTADGMTFDRWIERYVQRTLAGEDASLHESGES